MKHDIDSQQPRENLCIKYTLAYMTDIRAIMRRESIVFRDSLQACSSESSALKVD